MEHIFYKKGYKYQLAEPYEVSIHIKPQQSIVTDYVSLSSDGLLQISKSYAWDGPSGPTIDTRNFMRGSLVHDALYQLMRNEHLDKDTWRKPADKLLEQMCKEDGMSSIRAKWVYLGVRIGGDPAADPANKKPVCQAPE